MTNSVSGIPTGLLRQRMMNDINARTTECDGLRNVATHGHPILHGRLRPEQVRSDDDGPHRARRSSIDAQGAVVFQR